MSMQKLFHTRWITHFGLLVCRFVPRPIGYVLADVFAWAIAVVQPEMFCVLACNLSHVLGTSARAHSVQRAARRAFAHAGRTYLDFYRALGASPERLSAAVHLPAKLLDLLAGKSKKGDGVLILFAHMSNFDLAGLALAASGYRFQILTISEPPSGFESLNMVRQYVGSEATPITPGSLRKAIRRLKGGGIVASASDRAITTDELTVPFFGAQSYFPWGSARLALSSGATVLVVAAAWERKQGYFLQVSEPLEITCGADRDQDIEVNTKRIVEVVERFVEARPDQWLMFYPMWPDCVPETCKGSRQARHET